MITNNLQKRIESIDEYISLAVKLEEIVDEPEILGDISHTILPSLKDSRKLYLLRLEGQRRTIREIIDENQQIGRLACGCYNGDFQKAKEFLDDLDLNSKKYLFSYLGKALESALLCVLTAPFSRESSRLHHRRYESYRNTTISFFRSLKNSIKYEMTDKKIKRMRNNFLKQKFVEMHTREVNEFKLAEALTKLGLDEKTACYIVTEQPEIFDFFYLEFVRDKYGKGIV